MKRGDTVTLTIEKFADRGKSLARVEGFVVLVTGAVPGDTIEATVTRRKKSYAEARIDRVVTPSSLRTDPRCAYFGTCGGCKWQHVDYTAQLEAKRQGVQDAFEHDAGLEIPTVGESIGSPDTYFYRNKMEFSFSAERWLTKEEIASGERFDLQFALGLHAPGYFNKVIDLNECHLQSPESVRLVNGIRAFARAQEWSPWHIRQHRGFLRHLVIRQARHTDDLMVNLVTSSHDAERMEAFAAFVQAQHPEVTTLINAVNAGQAQTAFGKEMHTLFGPGVINDRIGGHTFEISPNAFFQTNTVQAERLYEVARDFARLKPEDRVYDLYCGAGTISLFLAGSVAQVIGVELIEEAVQNARANAERNDVKNVVFETGDMLKLFTPEFVARHGRPDVLVVDPPRAGMHPKVVRRIAELRPERIVYVSCNPRTQARDIADLVEAYTIDALQPVDLFPHTDHVENVAQLTARS